MAQPKIGVILGSTRPGRFSEIPGRWIHERAKASGRFGHVELLDLRDWPLPFFDEAGNPAYVPTKNETGLRWQAKLASLDGFIFVTPEYNRGTSAVLKNAIDYAYNEWNRKPIAYVGYGSAGGARAIEQLRSNSVELQAAPVRQSVNIMWPDVMAAVDGKKIDDLAGGAYAQAADQLIDNLSWWANALQAARAAS